MKKSKVKYDKNREKVQGRDFGFMGNREWGHVL